MDKQAALVKGTKKLKIAYDNLLAKNAELEQRLELFTKRARAEEILLEARSTPSSLRTSNLDEFLFKRAELENENSDRLDKIASAISMMDSTGDITITDENDNDDGLPKTFDLWVASRTNNY